MPHQFELGQRGYRHSTFIDANQGSKGLIYVRAIDVYGNKTKQSTSLSFAVDTLQKIIAWSDPYYPVKSWPKNNGPFGNGSNATTSITKVKTAYFVKEFELSKKPNSARLILQYNGGFALYINGFETFRYNLPGDIILDYNTQPLYTNKNTKAVTLDSESIDELKTGKNRIAVEIHGGSKSTECFDALFQTNIEKPFYYGSEWSYYDLGKMPEEFTLNQIRAIKSNRTR
jgi:hypothetical protein